MKKQSVHDHLSCGSPERQTRVESGEAKMDAAIKAKWVRALRSGKFKQARGSLRRGDGHYCCLGVLCEVSRAGDWQDGTFCAGPLGAMDCSLSEAAARKWGIPQKLVGALIGMNDEERKSFREIADYIEANL